MVCVQCHQVIEYVSPEIEALQEKIAKDHGCEIVDHTHVIWCPCYEVVKSRVEPYSIRVPFSYSVYLLVREINLKSGAIARFLSLTY